MSTLQLQQFVAFYPPRRAVCKFFLTPGYAEDRLSFAVDNGEKSAEWWSSVIFSDEKTFGYDQLDSIMASFIIMKLIFDSSDECGRVFAYHQNGTRFDKQNVQNYNRSGRKTVPVWGRFSSLGPGLFF